MVPTEALLDEGSIHTLRVNRSMVDGVVEAPAGAHFTSCDPDHGRDEAFQRLYARTAKDPEAWADFRARFVDVDEDTYHANVRELAEQEQRA